MSRPCVAVIATTPDTTNGVNADVSVYEVERGEIGIICMAARPLPVLLDEAESNVYETAAATVLGYCGWRLLSGFETEAGGLCALVEHDGTEDEREPGTGRDNISRLRDWVRDAVPDRRVAEDGPDNITMTGAALFELLHQAADRFYRYGTEDVGARPAHMREFFGGVQGEPR